MKEIISGIYMIQNKINGKIYIGQSINIYERWNSHINSSKNPKYPIQFAINSLGKDNFSFSILEKCDESKLNQRECFYIKLYHSTDKKFGYNLLQGGNTCEWTNEMKKKHSKILTKIHNTKKFKENSSKTMKKYWKEHKEEIIKNRKDVYDDDFKFKISKTIRKLWKNEEYRNKVSNSHKGNISHKNNTLVRCIETNETKTIFEWRSLGYISVKNVCEGKLKQTKGYSFEFVDESLRPIGETIIEYKNKRNEKKNSENKRLCLDPITKLPISYSSLSRKKQTKDKYKNIILKDCIIIDKKELEYYTNIRNKIRVMPYTYTNSKERRIVWEEKNKEKEKERSKRKREKIYLDPITNEKIRYDKLIYRKRTNDLYKNIVLKDCVI